MISLTSPLALGLLAAIKPISKRVKRKHETYVSVREPANAAISRLLAVCRSTSAREDVVIAAVEPVYHHVNVILGRPTSRLSSKAQAIGWLELAPQQLAATTDAKGLLGVQNAATEGLRSVSAALPNKRLLTRVPKE